MPASFLWNMFDWGDRGNETKDMEVMVMTDMNMKRQISRIGWAYTVFYLVSVGAQFLMVRMAQFLRPVLPEWVLSDNGLMMISQLCMYGFGFPAFYLMIKRLPCWHMREDRKIETQDLMLVVVLCLGSAYIGNMVGQAMMVISDTLFGTQSLNPVTDVLQDMSVWYVFFSTVLVAPVMEELMFRKLLIDRVVPFGQRLAVVISGVSFGLFHGNFYQFFYACSLGMIFAYLYSSTGKIRYSIALHMMINTMGGFLPLFLQTQIERGRSAAAIALMMLGLLIFMSILGTVVIGCMLWHRVTWFPSWIGEQGMGRVKSFLTASGIWAFLAVSMMEFVLMQAG